MSKSLRTGKSIDQKFMKGFRTLVNAAAAKLGGGSKNIVVKNDNKGAPRMTILKISKDRTKAG